MGGFITLITKLAGWILRSYQSFTFRKSAIKKLYYYSRTKMKCSSSVGQSDKDSKFDWKDDMPRKDSRDNKTLLLSGIHDFSTMNEEEEPA